MTADIAALTKGVAALVSSLKLMQNAQPNKGDVYARYSARLGLACSVIEAIQTGHHHHHDDDAAAKGVYSP